MKVVFRADASLQIGTGHIMRCLTLADALSERGASCSFVCRPHQGHLLALVAQRGHKALGLPELQESSELHRNGTAYAHWLGTSWTTDAQDTQQVLIAHTGGQRVDWLVVDHYALDARWEDALRLQAKRIMVIDDLADRPHVCDLLLDQTFGRRATDYVPLVPDGCRLLCGSQKYALLRPEFAALREYSLKRRAKPVLRELLINMGGVDKDNVTGAVLRALQSRPLPADCSLTVVMGQTAPWLKNVQVLACSMQRPTRVLVGIDNMAQLMADSDLAIGAAGATSWERCCLGLPSIMLVVADNQLEVAKGLEEAGAALLCLSDQGLSKQLAVLLDKLCADVEQITLLSKAAAKVADGTGAGEVLARMETDLSTHKSIRARKMRGGDLETVLRWRNHPEVRKYMLSQHKITMAEHRAWFDCSERDDTRALLVVEEDNLMIGCVVFSNVSCAGTADWSFYADPDSLTGTGRKVCEAALDFAFRELQIHRVAGQVLDFNEASIRTHIRLGFTQEGVLREHHLIDGKHLDVIVFGLLSYEWRERNKLFK